MVACTGVPNSVPGATIITSPPYNENDLVVFQCTTGYAMSGTPYITCKYGDYIGAYPKCNLQDTNSVSVGLSQDNNMPKWLLVLLAVLVGLILLLILTCLLVWCSKLLGRSGQGGLFGAPSRRINGSQHDAYEERENQRRQNTTFPIRPQYDDNGRRLHNEDLGSQSNHNHRHQNGIAHVTPIPVKEAHTITMVNEAEPQKTAKVQPIWMPHSNPIRNINTSTR